MEKLMCKKSFSARGSNGIMYNYVEGEMYFYWSNFQGFNHFVSDKEYIKENKNIIPFDGVRQSIRDEDRTGLEREYLYDYFYTKEEMRDIKINKIIKNC